MSFKTFSVQDPRIGDITDKLDYAVYKGAAQSTFQSFPSASASSSSVSFNVTPPSESTVVSREAMVETTTKFSITITNVPATEKSFSYAQNDSLQAFPFMSLVSTISASINNTNVSSNLSDTKDILLKCMDPKELAKYQDLCPSMVDSFYKVYSDGGTQCELNGYAQASYDKYLQPRGCHPLVSYSVSHLIGGTPTDDSLVSTGVTDSWIISMEVQTTEPLMLSPFIYGVPHSGSEMGFYGINQMNLVLNIDSSMRRFWSSKSSGYTYTFALDPTTPFRSNLLLNFLTVQPDQCINVKNVLPYLETPRYITPAVNVSSISAGATAEISTQNIQLSKVPDLILVAVRKPISSQSCFDSASFLPIQGVSVNFNNSSGLLSSASQKDLYKISTRNAVHQSWLEWSGYASTFDFVAADGQPISIPTIGSVLALNPAIDLSLDPAMANGSKAQLNLQMNVRVKNNGSTSISPEVVIICVSSGIMTTSAGNSSLHTGLLDRSLVMDASAAPRVSRTHLKRLVGSGLFESLGKALRSIPAVAEVIKGATGGAAKSAGASSGGRRLDKYA